MKRFIVSALASVAVCLMAFDEVQSQSLGSIKTNTQMYTKTNIDEIVNGITSAISTDKITDGTNTIDAAGNVYRGEYTDAWVNLNEDGAYFNVYTNRLGTSRWYSIYNDESNPESPRGFVIYNEGWWSFSESDSYPGSEENTEDATSLEGGRFLRGNWPIPVGKLALTNDIPPAIQVVSPSTNTTAGAAADAKATGTALYTGFTEWVAVKLPPGWTFISARFDGTDWLISILDQGGVGDVVPIAGTPFDLTLKTSIDYEDDLELSRHLVTPTKTSQLTNDGPPATDSNAGHPFATTNQIPDTTLYPVYGGNGQKYSAWSYAPDDGSRLAWSDQYGGWFLYGFEGIEAPLSIDIDVLSITYGSPGGNNVTATRTPNPVVGYKLGTTQNDKPLQPQGNYQDALSDAQVDAIDSVVDDRQTVVVYQNGTTNRLDLVGELSSGDIPNIGDATSVRIGSAVTSIGNGALSECFNLTSVTIPNSVTSIGNGAFALSDRLTSVTMPDSVTSIGNGAFYNCTRMTRMTIPASMTNIGDNVFAYCSGLTSVTIPNSVTSIGSSVFESCSGLTNVVFKGKSLAEVSAMPNYSSWGINTSIITTENEATQEWVGEQMKLSPVYGENGTSLIGYTLGDQTNKVLLTTNDHIVVGTNNTTISSKPNIIGSNIQVGSKAWYYSAIAFSTNVVGKPATIYLTDDISKRNTGLMTTNTSFQSGYLVNDVLSLVNKAKYDNCCKVTSVNGNVIGVDKIPFTSIVTNQTDYDDYIVTSTNKPAFGVVSIGDFSFAMGSGHKVYRHLDTVFGRDNAAFGDYALIGGRNNSGAYGAFAAGRDNIASGQYSTAVGSHAEALADRANAEGYYTRASGVAAHAEGAGTSTDLLTASGDYSHAEGSRTKATGSASHAEGNLSQAKFASTHAEGEQTKASSSYSHAEGYRTEAGNGTANGGWCSHAEGNTTYSKGQNSHSEGNFTIASGKSSHAEGSGVSSRYLEAKGQYSHAEGACTYAHGDASHAEGYLGVSYGGNSHFEGGGRDLVKTYKVFWAGSGSSYTSSVNHDLIVNDIIEINGEYRKVTSVANAKKFSVDSVFLGPVSNSTVSVREGTSVGADSHTEGRYSTSIGIASHAEGFTTRVSGDYAHAEGQRTYTEARGAHVEGVGATDTEALNLYGAKAVASHVEGIRCLSESGAQGGHAEGMGTVIKNHSEHAQGRYNVSHVFTNTFGHSGNTLHSIGFGYSANARTNAVEVMQNGRVFVCGVGGYDGTNPTGADVKDIATILGGVALTNDVHEEISRSTSQMWVDTSTTPATTNFNQNFVPLFHSDYLDIDPVVGKGYYGDEYNSIRVYNTALGILLKNPSLTTYSQAERNPVGMWGVNLSPTGFSFSVGSSGSPKKYTSWSAGASGDTVADKYNNYEVPWLDLMNVSQPLPTIVAPVISDGKIFNEEDYIKKPVSSRALYRGLRSTWVNGHQLYSENDNLEEGEHHYYTTIVGTEIPQNTNENAVSVGKRLANVLDDRVVLSSNSWRQTDGAYILRPIAYNTTPNTLLWGDNEVNAYVVLYQNATYHFLTNMPGNFPTNSSIASYAGTIESKELDFGEYGKFRRTPMTKTETIHSIYSDQLSEVVDGIATNIKVKQIFTEDGFTYLDATGALYRITVSAGGSLTMSNVVGIAGCTATYTNIPNAQIPAYLLESAPADREAMIRTYFGLIVWSSGQSKWLAASASYPLADLITNYGEELSGYHSEFMSRNTTSPETIEFEFGMDPAYWPCYIAKGETTTNSIGKFALMEDINGKANAADLPYVLVAPGEWEFSGLPNGVTAVMQYAGDNSWEITLSNGDHQSMGAGGENAMSVEYPASEWMEGIATYPVTATRASLPGHLFNRANNLVKSSDTLQMTLPPPIPNKSRDFRVRLVITAPITSPDKITFVGATTNGVQESISFETENGTFPMLNTISTNILHFTETAPSIFYISNKAVTLAPAP